MVQVKSYLQDLDDAISRGTAESRARALWHVTDLLIAGRYNDDEIFAFGKVIGRLADEIEVEVRAQLSERLAHFSRAPVDVIYKLAFDDAIEVARPVLEHSEQLDDAMLIANARSKSQAHMLAISRRKSLGESVTDVLVARGNRAVVNSVAGNGGARLSGSSLLHMIKRAEGDSILAEQLGLRKDIPRQLFQQLIAKASEDVRRRLERERPDMIEEIGNSVVDVAGALQSRFGPSSRSYFVAKRIVTNQHRLGNLNEVSLTGYAVSHRFEEVMVALSLLSGLPGDVVERALLDRNREMLLIIAKALRFSWQTTLALLFLGAKDHRITARELQDLEREFTRLNFESSKKVLDVCRLRKNAGSDAAGLAHDAQLAPN
jgi:uncharacterized protein (DUF2336 family)